MLEICAEVRSNEQKPLPDFVISGKAEVRVTVSLSPDECEAKFVKRGRKPVSSTHLSIEGGRLHLDEFLIPLVGKEAYQKSEVLVLPGTLSSHCGKLNGYAIMVFVGQKTYIIANIQEMKDGEANPLFHGLYFNTRSLVLA